MVPLTDLWLPILVSAVVLQVVSSIIHMACRSGMTRLPALATMRIE